MQQSFTRVTSSGRWTCLAVLLLSFPAAAVEPGAQAIGIPIPVEGAALHVVIDESVLQGTARYVLPLNTLFTTPGGGESILQLRGGLSELGIQANGFFFDDHLEFRVGVFSGARNKTHLALGGAGRVRQIDLSDNSASDLLFPPAVAGNTLQCATFVTDTSLIGGFFNTTGNSPSGFFRYDTATGVFTPIVGSGLPANNAFGYSDGSTALEVQPPSGAGPAATVLFGFAYNGIYRSTDGGLTMAPVPGLPSFLGVNKFAHSGSSIVSATTAGLYRSTNDGQSFAKVNAGLPAGAASDVVIGPDGTSLWAAVNAPAPVVYKSFDGGVTWAATGPGIDVKTINSVSTAGPDVFAGTSNGIFSTTDNGATWRRVPAPSFASILKILPVGNTLFAGTFGNSSGVMRSDDDGDTWSATGGPAVAYKIVRALHASGTTVLAGGEGGFFRSIDNGVTFTEPARASIGLPVSGTPYAFAPVGSSTFLGLNPGGVYKSANDGATWTSSNAGLPAGVLVSSLVSTGNTLYLGSNGPLYRSADAGTTWSAVTPPNPAGPNSVYSLLVDGGALYAGTFGFGTPDTHGLFKSTNSGATWTRLANGLPSNRPVYALAADGSRVYAGLSKGLFFSEDNGATWKIQEKSLETKPIFSLGVAPPSPPPSISRKALAAGPTGRLIVGTGANGVRALDVPRRTRRLVPIVLDVDTGSAHYTTELALTNRGAKTAAVSLLYTASIGTGSGSASETLAAGQQLVVADAISYLRGKGVPIPTGAGSVGGTLLVTFDGLDEVEAVSVTARTTTATAAPQPAGAAGLAYAAIDPDTGGSTGLLTLFGLRTNASDRTNLAVYNTSAQAVTLRVTAWSGEGTGASSIIEASAVLPAYGWKQYNRILEGPGYATGWATVERVSAAGAFGAYAVINDNGTSDGSFVLPTAGGAVFGEYLNVPVLVETGAFVSELVLSNAGASAATFNLSYRESLSPGSGAGGSVAISVPARSQVIYPGAIAELRRRGVAVGPAGGSYAGSLHVSASGVSVNDLFAGARTASPSPASGQFGLFTPAFYPGEEASESAYVYGLRADGQNRSNVAMINTGQTAGAGSITLQAQVYDGDAGGIASGSAESTTLAPGQWAQLSGIVGAKNVKNGWVKITRMAGTSPWIAYGVVNDGGGPGQRTGDGAYLPMTR
ncbi:MAG: hypothetical protein PT977_04730 [Acidobacteriota bacterium]|nr:hypothetical protein [Acidobacteriota bacterium]